MPSQKGDSSGFLHANGGSFGAMHGVVQLVRPNAAAFATISCILPYTSSFVTWMLGKPRSVGNTPVVPSGLSRPALNPALNPAANAAAPEACAAGVRPTSGA